MDDPIEEADEQGGPPAVQEAADEAARGPGRPGSLVLQVRPGPGFANTAIPARRAMDAVVQFGRRPAVRTALRYSAAIAAGAAVSRLQRRMVTRTVGRAVAGRVLGGYPGPPAWGYVPVPMTSIRVIIAGNPGTSGSVHVRYSSGSNATE
jgi:hypothetical protein